MSVTLDEDSSEDDPIILLKSEEERVLNFNPPVNDFNKKGEENKANGKNMIDMSKSLHLDYKINSCPSKKNIVPIEKENEERYGKKIDFKRNIGLVGMKITNFKIGKLVEKTTNKLVVGKNVNSIKTCSKEQSATCLTEKKKKSIKLQNSKSVDKETITCFSNDIIVKKIIQPKINTKIGKQERKTSKITRKSKNKMKNVPRESNVSKIKNNTKKPLAKEINTTQIVEKYRRNNSYNSDGTEDYCIKDTNLGKKVCDNEKRDLMFSHKLPEIMDEKNSQNVFHLNKLKAVSFDQSLKAMIPDWNNLTKNDETVTRNKKKQSNVKNKIPKKRDNVKVNEGSLCKQNSHNTCGTINKLTDNPANHPRINLEKNKCSSGADNLSYNMSDWCKAYKYFYGEKQLEKQMSNQMEIPNNLWRQNKAGYHKLPTSLNNFPFFLPGVPFCTSTSQGQNQYLSEKNRIMTEKVPPPKYKIVAMPLEQPTITRGNPSGPNILLSNNKYTSDSYKSKQGIILNNLKEAIKTKRSLNRVLVTLPLVNRQSLKGTHKTDEIFPSSCGYSPPILPIPSYQNYLELMARNNNNANSCEVPGTTDVARTNKASQSIKTSSVNMDRPDLNQTNLVKKRTLDLEEAKQEAVSNKIVKKISLEEYKKRCFKGDTCIDLTETDACGKHEMNLDQSKNDDSDNGYDSDSTVKLKHFI